MLASRCGQTTVANPFVQGDGPGSRGMEGRPLEGGKLGVGARGKTGKQSCFRLLFCK